MDKGPMGMGLRLQDSLRLGAFKVEACAAKVATDGAQGGKDEAWGGRAFVRYDWLPVSVVDLDSEGINQCIECESCVNIECVCKRNER